MDMLPSQAEAAAGSNLCQGSVPLTSVPLLRGCCSEHVRDRAVVEGFSVTGSKGAASSVPSSLREPGKDPRVPLPTRQRAVR